jgi:hypothetical protein
MDEREIEAVARALTDWPDEWDEHDEGDKDVFRRMAADGITALDRVRDARGDDERSALNQTCCSGCTEAVRDEEPLRFRSGVLWHEACLAARSPQAEDHEASE